MFAYYFIRLAFAHSFLLLFLGLLCYYYIMQRLDRLQAHLVVEPTKVLTGERLRLRDNRTGKIYQVSLKEDKDCFYINSKDLAKVTNAREEPLRIYDPGYKNTICCTSRISYIDGIRGVLEYRGYPIEQLAERSSFLEVAFLLIFGELPSVEQLADFSQRVLSHTAVHTDALQLMRSFRYDAHPMGILISAIAAYGTLHPEANITINQQNYTDLAFRNKQLYKLLGVVPTLAALAYRLRIGREYNQPREGLGFTENLLYMLDRLNEKDYKPHPKLVRALEVLFIIHAEHQVGCSTSFVRHLASAGVDLYTTISMAAGALYGPKHGGANTAVIHMLEQIGTKDRIRRFLMEVKLKKRTLYGFGNRVYKNYDPRAKIIKQVAIDVFSICGKEPLIEIALELQRTALQDDYFITRKLYPNVDFYSGLIYRSMGFPTDMFPVLYAIPRLAGWLAHWVEFQSDRENNLYRPRQNYAGSGRREFVEMSQRTDHPRDIEATSSQAGKRRETAKRHAEQNRE